VLLPVLTDPVDTGLRQFPWVGYFFQTSFIPEYMIRSYSINQIGKLVMDESWLIWFGFDGDSIWFEEIISFLVEKGNCLSKGKSTGKRILQSINSYSAGILIEGDFIIKEEDTDLILFSFAAL
jgi:hypothetical protein